MFNGYLERAGVELINTERLGAYIDNQLPGHPLRTKLLRSDGVRAALGDKDYESPLIDGAEWVTAADPATHGFYGLYPLDIEGVGSSTLSASVVEAIGDGGYMGGSRDTTRQIKVSALMIGADELAVEAGMTWLRAALRSDGCGAHAGTCGGSDLRFFLADPAVCDPKWSALESDPITVPLGTLTPSTSPIIHRFDSKTVDPTMPMRAWWEMPRVDGAVIRWGRMALDSQTPLEESPNIILRRTNYVTNPTFAENTTGWTPGTGTGASWIASGGSDGGSFARVRQTVNAPVYRTNWIASSSFESPAAATVWRTNDPNGVQLVTASDAPHGGAYGRVDGVPVGERWVETTLLGPAIPADGSISFSIGQLPAPVTATVRDAQGQTVTSETFTADIAWQRMSFATQMGEGYTLRLTTTANTALSMDAFIAEDGATVTAPGGGGYGQGTYGAGTYGVGSGSGGSGIGNYFDGSDASGSGVTYYFLGNVGTSASRRQAGAIAPIVYSTGVLDSPYGAVTTSVAMRAPNGATVVMRMISGDDQSVLVERSVTLTGSWSRFVLGAPFGRNVQLQFTSMGDFDIDQVILEAGESALDYFDGGSVPVPDYTLVWLGAPHLSASRMDYDGTFLMNEGDAAWRPFVTALAGTIPDVQLLYVLRDEVPMTTQLEPYERMYHNVEALGGPTVVKRFATRSGAMTQIEFLLVARSPHAYSPDRLVLSDPNLNEYRTVANAVAVDTTPAAIVDPNLPALASPPRPPTIPVDGFGSDPAQWRRYEVNIPADEVALWATTVPSITLTSSTSAFRRIRVRLYPNPFGYSAETVDPLSYCSEFIVSYLPTQTTLTMNGITQRAFAAVAGAASTPADNLLYGSGGVPMTWPELSCGIPYLMTVDVPTTEAVPTSLAIDLVFNRRE